eukprot:4311943-Alexandrium_andersonii.AAC.1
MCIRDRFFCVKHSTTKAFQKRMRDEQAEAGSSMTGKSTKDLIGSLTAGQASSPADTQPSKEQVLEGLLADQPSPEKG